MRFGKKALWIVFVFAALTMMNAGTALAHPGHVHKVMGTVMARDAKHVEVKTPSGEVLSIAITDKTSVIRANKKVALDAVQTGHRVIVDIGDGEDPLIAREIQVGAAVPATK